MDYEDLSPDIVLDAVESQGFSVDGRYIVLNSYENRVYQVNLLDEAPVIAKFYRPNRWSDASILEDHGFSAELLSHELPVIAPWQNKAGGTLFYYDSFRFSIYPRKGGHAPEHGNLDQLYRLGGLIGRMHAFGASKDFQHRRHLTVESHCTKPAAYLLANGFIPAELEEKYRTLTDQIQSIAAEKWQSVSELSCIRVHGDCHLSNIIWARDDQPWLLDFDDVCMAPAVQDLWMLVSGSLNEQRLQLSELLEGYANFYDFNLSQLKLVEPLRSLRMIHYSAWLAQRWSDPAFKQHFPWFNTQHYWQQQVTELASQVQEMQKPSI